MMEDNKKNNPWLGLESYQEGEILYGRDEDIRDLTQCVLNDTDTLLYGKSGIGKSSILNAGVIPAARRNGYHPVSVRLSHKEQHSYLYQIRETIAKETDIREVVPCKDKNRESLYEFFHRHTFHDKNGDRVKLLIVFDQFEEIFTLQDSEQKKKSFFTELADFLNDVMPSYLQTEAVEQTGEKKEIDLTDANAFDNLFESLDLDIGSDITEYINDNEIHMVFTIREDFLSEFEYYTATIPSLKQGRYGLRPINEEQAAQIILRPVPGLISEDVARLIIEKVTGRTDFELDGIPEIEVDSAVLSLYLNRLYDAKKKKKITARLVEQKGGEIIADFYNEAISCVSDSTIEYLEEMLLNGQNRRDNITVFDAINDGHVTEEELDILCNKKKVLRQFNYAGDMRIEYVHDILCPVVKAHKDERLRLKQDEEERRRQEEEKQRILQEEENKRREIEQKAEAERAEMLAQAQRVKRRNRHRLIALGATMLLMLAGGLCYWWYYDYEHVSYYAAFERVHGWPKGIGKPLSNVERSKMPLYYKLTHTGHQDHDTDVEVLSSNGALPVAPRVPTLLANDKDGDDVQAKSYYDLLAKVGHIHFVESENGKVDKEIYLAEDQSTTLFVINYFHLDNGKEAWCQFVTPSGQAMSVRDNGVDRIKLSWFENSDDAKDPFNGHIESLMFFDALGVCFPAADSICGYSYRFVNNSTTYRFALDEYGRPQQKPYNVVMTKKDDDKVEVTYGKAVTINDSIPATTVGPQGYGSAITRGDVTEYFLPGKDTPIATREVKHDQNGNVTEERTTGDLPVPALVKYSYATETGYMTNMEKYDADGKPFVSESDSIYKKHWQYAANGELELEEHWNAVGMKTYLHRITRTQKVVTDQLEDTAHNIFLTRVDSTLTDHMSTTYYGKGNQPVTHKVVEGEDSLYCHRVVTKTGDGVTTLYHFTLNEKGTVVPCPKQLNKYGKALSYYCREEGIDKDGNKIYYRLLDVDGTVIKSMMRYYQNGQDVARAVMGVEGYGHPVRCANWEEEGYGYYKLYFSKDFKRHYVSVRAVNEWEAPSVFYDGNEQIYLTITYNDYKGDTIFIGNERINIMYSYKQFSLDKAEDVTHVELPYLHVLDKQSPLYANGLRDGDRIIALGSWKQGMPTSLFNSEWSKMKNKTMSISVLRPNIHSFDSITKELTRGNAEKEECHIFALTTNELKQFYNYVRR